MNKVVNVRVSLKVKQKLEELAEMYETSVSEYIRMRIDEAIDLEFSETDPDAELPVIIINLKPNE